MSSTEVHGGSQHRPDVAAENETFFGAARRIALAAAMVATLVAAVLISIEHQAGILVYVWLGAYFLVALHIAGRLAAGTAARLASVRSLEIWTASFLAVYVCVIAVAAAAVHAQSWLILTAAAGVSVLSQAAVFRKMRRFGGQALRASWEPPRPSLLSTFPLLGWLKQAAKMSIVPVLAIIELVALGALALLLLALWVVVEVGLGMLQAIPVYFSGLATPEAGGPELRRVVLPAILGTVSAILLGTLGAFLLQLLP